MATIDRVFNQIWRVKKSRPLMQRILVYWAIITLGPLLIGVSISVTSYLYAATNGVVTSVPLIGASFYTLISVLLTTAAFTLLYIAVPNQWVDWRDAIWGGLLAGVAVEIAKRLFAAYIIKFPTYTMVYGAVAALPILPAVDLHAVDDHLARRLADRGPARWCVMSAGGMWHRPGR